eukprot:14866100-Alexandrium_andersonii.AAC.1
MQNLSHRISALEARPTGAQSVFTDGAPNQVGPPPAFAGTVATGVGSSSWNANGGRQQTWGPQEWEVWRRGSWRRPDFPGASA